MTPGGVTGSAPLISERDTNSRRRLREDRTEAVAMAVAVAVTAYRQSTAMSSISPSKHADADALLADEAGDLVGHDAGCSHDRHVRLAGRTATRASWRTMRARYGRRLALLDGAS